MPETEIAGRKLYKHEHAVKNFNKIEHSGKPLSSIVEFFKKSGANIDDIVESYDLTLKELLEKYNHIIDEYETLQDFMTNQQEIVKALITENHELKKNIKILENTLEQM